MYIVWGSKLMGKCDVVPGLFHVATKFGHLYYLPLIPTGSYVVLGQDAHTFRGVPVSLSLKSILLAWSRAITLVIAVGAGCMALVMGLDKHPGAAEWVGPAAVSALFVFVCCMLCFSKFATRASFNRACELAKELGLNEAGYEHISKVYGQAVPRGFAPVKPAVPTPAIPVPPLGAPQRAPQAKPVSRTVPDDDGAIPLADLPPAPTKKPVANPGRIGLT